MIPSPSAMPLTPRRRLAVLACAALLAAGPAVGSAVALAATPAATPPAAPPAPAAEQAAKPERPEHAEKADAPPRDVRTYCANIAVAASDARIAWQTARLAELESRLKASIQALDARTAELRALAEKRAATEKAAGEKLVGIYGKMRPETAAAQISGLDDEMAAAVLGQLNARQAGLIFNEFVPERAAKLAVLVAGVQPDKTSPDKTSPPDKTLPEKKP